MENNINDKEEHNTGLIEIKKSRRGRKKKKNGSLDAEAIGEVFADDNEMIEWTYEEEVPLRKDEAILSKWTYD